MNVNIWNVDQPPVLSNRQSALPLMLTENSSVIRHNHIHLSVTLLVQLNYFSSGEIRRLNNIWSNKSDELKISLPFGNHK